MLINILVIIVIGIAGFIGGYLVSHRNKEFLTLNPVTDPVVHSVAVWGGTTLLLIALIGIGALIWHNAIFIIVVLLMATVVVTAIQFILFNHLKIK